MSDVISTKRAYAGLADYAAAHHVTADVFSAAGWKSVQHHNRPALMFQTTSGPRYRFLDGAKPTYIHETGYKPCWYGLQRAVKMGAPIVDCNGAPSTVVAQHYGIAAFSLQVGEGARLTHELIQQVKAIYSGVIIVAFDCDDVGRRAARQRIWDWRRAGMTCYAVDLGLSDGGDLADFAATKQDITTCKRLDIGSEPIRPIGTRHAYSSQTQDELLEKAQIALDALASWRCDEEPAWAAVGRALKMTFGDLGLPLFDAWSARSTHYKTGHCERRWRSWTHSPLTIGSIFFWADEDSGKSWRDRLRKKTTKSAKNSPAPIVGLSDSVRSALLCYAHPSVIPVAEVWTEAVQTGLLKTGDPIDAKRLREVSLDLKRPVSDRTIRAGLTHGTGLFFAKSVHVFNKQERTNPDLVLDSATGIPGAGRKATYFELLPMAQVVKNLARASVAPILEKCFPPTSEALAPVCTALLESLGLPEDEARVKAAELRKSYGSLIKAQPGYRAAYFRAKAEYARFVRSFANQTSTFLPHDLSIATGGEYVAAYARATVLAAKGRVMQKGRAWWRERLGAKDRALPTIWRKAGIEVEKKVLVARPIASVTELLPITSTYDFERAGKPEKLVSSLDKKPLKFEPCPPLYRWVQEQLDRGATVTLMYHQANRQRLAPPAKRLVYAAIAAVERLIGFLADLLKPPAKQLALLPEPEVKEPAPAGLPEPEPEAPDERFTYKPPKTPAPPEPTYAEFWVKGLFSRATTYDLEGEQAVDLTSGEIVQYSTQLALDLLLQPVENAP